MGGDVIVSGRVDSDAVAVGGDVEIRSGGQVRGDAVSVGGDIVVRNGGLVRGDAVAIGGKVIRDDGSVVLGDAVSLGSESLRNLVTRIIPDNPDSVFRGFFRGIHKPSLPFTGVFGIFGMFVGSMILLVKILTAVLVGLLITHLFPAQVDRMARFAEHRFPMALLMGVVAAFAVPFAILALVITIIGIPLVPLALVALVGVYLFGATGIALWVGRIVPEADTRSMYLNVALGVLVIQLLKAIPVLGIIAGIGFGVASLGVVLLARSPHTV